MIGQIRRNIIVCLRQRKETLAQDFEGTTIQASLYPITILCLCFCMALLFTLSTNHSARADIDFSAPQSRTGHQLLQTKSPLLSPIAMAGQDTIASNISAPNTSAAANAGASVSSGVAANSVDIGVYKDARSDTLPLLAGTQANQTSLVLVGAVLVALMLVVGLAVSRKEA